MDYLPVKIKLQSPIRSARVEAPASFVTSETDREIIALCLQLLLLLAALETQAVLSCC